MPISPPLAVPEPQFSALAAADRDGWIRPEDGIGWATLQAMAERRWVTLHDDDHAARLTRAGVAMISVGREERERDALRAEHRSYTRDIDPFRLITGTGVCASPSLRRR